MENQDSIIDKILTWSSGKTGSGKSFDELFTIDGISVGWFFKKLFLPGVIPKNLDVYKLIQKKQGLSLAQRTRFAVTAKALRKIIMFNEKKKFAKCKKKENVSVGSKSKKNVLFLTFNNFISKDGSNFRIQEVIDELKKKKGFQEKILYASPLSARFSKDFAALPTIYQYYDSEIEAKAKNISSALYKQWQELDSKTREEFVQLEGKSLWPFMKYLFDFYVSKEFFFLLAAYFEIAKKIINEDKITLVILTSPNSLIERCFVAAAKLRSVPCIVIQHGVGLSRLIDFSCPVHYAVFGEQTKKKVLDAGAPSDYLHVTGPVVFDQAHHYKAKVQKDSKALLVVTGPYVEDNNLPKKVYFERMSKILAKIASIPNHTIILKLHPREKHKDEYEKILKEHNIRHASFFDNNAPREKFYEAIAQCKSFVSFGSTASIEAMIIGKPIVTINPTDTFDIVSLLEDATINVYYYEDIKAAIERSFLDEKTYRKKREKYLEKYCGLVDGKASERVVKLVLHLTQTPSSNR